MARRFFDPPTDSGKAGMPTLLKAKMFGLPRWAWLAILAGGLTIGLVLRARANAAADEVATEDAQGDPAVPVATEDQFGYAPDTGYDTGMTLSPAAEGGYYGYPDAGNDAVTATPDGPYTDNSRTYKLAGKGNKLSVRGDDNRTGPSGGGSASGHTGGHGRKHKPKKKHSMTGGGAPKNRHNHGKPPKKKSKK